MCQPLRLGGRRCPIHRHDSMAYIRDAAIGSTLNTAQAQDLFRELRREGRTAVAVDEKTWKHRIGMLADGYDGTENAAIAQEIRNTIDTGATVPDHATAYAQNILAARARQRGEKLDARIAEIATAGNIEPSEAKRRYEEFYRNVDRSRGSSAPTEFTSTTRRRAVVAGLPYDRSTVTALEQLKASIETGPRRIALTPVRSTSLSTIGYDASGDGRLEVTFASNPDRIYAYHNVSEQTWTELSTSYSVGSYYARNIRGNAEYLYDSQEESDADAYVTRCSECGQFAAAGHRCPPRDRSAEISDEVSENFAEEAAEPTPTLLVDDEYAPSADVLNEDDSVSSDEIEESADEPERSDDERTVEQESTPRRGRRRAAVKTEEPDPLADPNRIVLEEDAPVVDKGAEAFIARVQDDYSEEERTLVPPAHTVTVESQLTPVRLQAAEGKILLEEGVSEFALDNKQIRDSRYSYHRELIGEAGVAMVESLPDGAKVAFKHARSADGRRAYETLAVVPAGFDVDNRYGYDGTKSYIKFGGVPVNVDRFPGVTELPERRMAAINERDTENTRLAMLHTDGEAEHLIPNVTATRRYVFDANMKKQPAVLLPPVRELKQSLNDGKAVVFDTKLEFPAVYSHDVAIDGSYYDDQGFSYGGDTRSTHMGTGRKQEVFGTVAFQKDKDGVVRLVGGRRSLQCDCATYRRNYHCVHVDSTVRHLNNVVAQASAKKVSNGGVVPTRHPLLNAALSRRSDVNVIEEEGKPPVISFGATLGDQSIRPLGRFNDTLRYGNSSYYAPLPKRWRDGVPQDDILEFDSYSCVSFHDTKIPRTAPSDLKAAFRLADYVEFPLKTSVAGYDAFRNSGTVTGSVVFTKDEEGNPVFHERRLKCSCTEYQEKYDCPHVRAVADQSTLFLRARESRALNSMRNNEYREVRRANEQQVEAERLALRAFGYSDEYREAASRSRSSDYVGLYRALSPERREHYRAEGRALQQREAEERAESERRIEAEREERWRREAERRKEERAQAKAINAPTLAAGRERLRATAALRQSDPGPSFTENPDVAFAAYDRARKDKDQGKPVFEFKTENVTDGICAPVDGGRTFGVELEFDLPKVSDRQQEAVLEAIGKDLYAAGLTDSARQGYYHSGAQGNWQKWSFERDGTVAGELVSPIMRDTPEDWEALRKATEIIKKHGGAASTKAGSHVHVNTGSYGSSQARHMELARLSTENHDTIYRMASNPFRGTHRGEEWCRANVAKLDDHHPDVESHDSDDYKIANAQLDYNLRDHATMLNMGACGQQVHAKSHVEFRSWDSTLDASIIQQQVKISAAMVDAAERRVEENKGSISRTEERYNTLGKLGANKKRDADILSKHGAKTHKLESFTESYGHVTEFIDTLFRRKEDKDDAMKLFAINNWAG